MSSRLYVAASDAPAWLPWDEFELPAVAARHVQVLRLQPGMALTLFNGHGGQWQAEVLHMGRQAVGVRLIGHEAVERELPVAVTLAICMPANDRMDDLVEKATELGAAAIVPLVSERSVLRLSGDRAAKRQAHWQAVAVAASEQCGRNRVTQVLAVQGLEAFLADGQAPNGGGGTRWQLSLAAQALPLGQAVTSSSRTFSSEVGAHICLLSGPAGGLSPC